MYNEISFPKFFMGLIVIVIPAVVMNELGWQSWVWGYVLLILISFAVFQSRGLGKFASYVNSIE
jgi:hypothetical protein